MLLSTEYPGKPARMLGKIADDYGLKNALRPESSLMPLSTEYPRKPASMFGKIADNYVLRDALCQESRLYPRKTWANVPACSCCFEDLP